MTIKTKDLLTKEEKIELLVEWLAPQMAADNIKTEEVNQDTIKKYCEKHNQPERASEKNPGFEWTNIEIDFPATNNNILFYDGIGICMAYVGPDKIIKCLSCWNCLKLKDVKPNSTADMTDQIIDISKGGYWKYIYRPSKQDMRCAEPDGNTGK